MSFNNYILYIGPGLGAGTIAAIIGILTSFIISLIAIFWYPFKRLVKFIQSKINTK